MEWVVQVRQANQSWKYPLPKDLPPVVGFVAVADCDRIGEQLIIFHELEGWNGPYLVADCANKLEKHDLELKRKGIVVEVDFNTAARWGVIGLGPEYINVCIVEWDTLQGAP